MNISWPDASGKLLSDSIPANLRDYIEVLGMDDAAHLFRTLGGVSLYIASETRGHQSRSKIVQTIGPEKAAALARRLGAGIQRIRETGRSLPATSGHGTCRFWKSHGSCKSPKCRSETTFAIHRPIQASGGGNSSRSFAGTSKTSFPGWRRTPNDRRFRHLPLSCQGRTLMALNAARSPLSIRF
ncbi:hypothetical protein [Ensifer soli]|uniref:hypothetical protein n=1 Tax=Ciceribacter sp. sgz301302 TaxID=3342379 RepID=UPI0035B7FFCD